MALSQHRTGASAPTRFQLEAIGVVVIALLLVMLALSFAYPLTGVGPSLQIVPDPAGNAIPF
jgi:hypothetical protein